MPSGSEWEASDTNWSSWTEISEPEENCEASDGGNSGFRGTGRPCESRTRGFRRAENRIAAVSPPYRRPFRSSPYAGKQAEPCVARPVSD